MITVEGAKLLAALIPVLVLVLAVERRALGPEQRPLYVVGLIWFWLKVFGQSIGAGVAVIMLAPLFMAVNANVPLDGFWALVTLGSVTLTGVGVVGTVMPLVMRGYLGSADMEARAERIRLRRLRFLAENRARRRARNQRRASVEGG